MTRLLPALLLLALASSADASCAKIDYAEAKDMKEEEIISTFCEYSKEWFREFERRNDHQSKVCREQADQLERVFKRRFDKELKYKTYCGGPIK